jgi:hypothetical protein
VLVINSVFCHKVEIERELIKTSDGHNIICGWALIVKSPPATRRGQQKAPNDPGKVDLDGETAMQFPSTK